MKKNKTVEKLTDYKVFDSEIIDNLGWSIIQNALIEVVKNTLYKRLTKSQIEIFETKSYYYEDGSMSAMPKKIKATQGLLEHLIQRVVIRIENFNEFKYKSENRSLVPVDGESLVKRTGISDLKILKKEIKDINKRWSGIAKIEVGDPGHVTYILFELK